MANMTVASVAFGLEFTEWLVIGGAMYGIAELAGLSRSARTIRRENTDLRQRNDTLEKDVQRLAAEVQRLDGEVRRLEQNDQAAVLAALRDYETGAKDRFEKTYRVLNEIHDTLKEGATG